MKFLTIAAFVAAQIIPNAAPAFAAEFAQAQEQKAGVFGGVRVRVPLDGHRRNEGVRAGLTLAPTLHSRSQDGETRLRMGEGIELGVSEREQLRLAIAGQDVRRLAGAAQDAPESEEEDDDDDFTWGHAALILGGVIVVAVGALYLVVSNIEGE